MTKGERPTVEKESFLSRLGGYITQNGPIPYSAMA